MNKNMIFILIILAAFAGLVLYIISDKNITKEGPVNNNVDTTTVQVPIVENMNLVVFVQDKEIAKTSDCRATVSATYQIPKTNNVTEASLKILFSDDLKDYGVYKSVSIENGVAKIILESDMTPQDVPIGSLSSCESGHLLSVLTDTLTQYDSIESVKLYSPKGEIVF